MIAAIDAYKILGIAETASRDELDAAYREMVKRHHPDRRGDTRAFLQVQEAYEMLTARSAEKAAIAARTGAASAAPAKPPTGPTKAPPDAEYDPVESRRATAAAWKAREQFRDEQRAAALKAREQARAEQRAAAKRAADEQRARRTGETAKRPPLWSIAVAMLVLAAVATESFLPIQYKLIYLLFVIPIGAILLPPAVASKLKLPAIVIGVILLFAAELGVAAACTNDWRFAILIGSTVPAILIGRTFERPVIVAVGIFLLVGGMMGVATWCVGLEQAIEYEQHPSENFDPGFIDKFFQIEDLPK